MQRLLPLLVALVFVSSLRAEDRIEVSARFIEAKAGLHLPHDLAALNQLDGVDLVSSPRVTSRPGQKAEIAVEQDLKAPVGGFVTDEEKPFTGVRLKAVGSFQGDGIAYRLQATKCEIVGASPDSMQRETVSHDLYANGTARDGETIWLTLSLPDEERQRFVLVTFKRVRS